MKDPIKVKRGKKSRASGAAFELRVRKDLEESGWIVDKWTNNVEFGYFEDGVPLKFIPQKYNECVLKDGSQIKSPCARLTPAKPKFLFIKGSMRMVGNSSGFPDFVAIRPIMSYCMNYERVNGERKGVYKKVLAGYEVIGVESKMTGELDKEEKEKCQWLLRNKIFSKILIAEKTKVKNRIVIKYHDFVEKYT